MSKREARIARQLAKRLKSDEKSARLREQVPDQTVRVDESVDPGKSVRLGANPYSIFGMNVSWTSDSADVEGSWSWGVERQWTAKDWTETILPSLMEWEKLTWAEVDRFASGSGHKMHHNMDTCDICEEAQYRMVEIDRYADVIFRFRLSNQRRLWGHRIVNKFEVLWFDPTHQIYPTDPE